MSPKTLGRLPKVYPRWATRFGAFGSRNAAQLKKLFVDCGRNVPEPSGFRVHPQGAQGRYGVVPDLTTLGTAPPGSREAFITSGLSTANTINKAGYVIQMAAVAYGGQILQRHLRDGLLGDVAE